jgi:RNase P subunit RPR2
MYKCPHCDSPLILDKNQSQVINEENIKRMLSYHCNKCQCDVQIYSNINKKPVLLEVKRGRI